MKINGTEFTEKEIKDGLKGFCVLLVIIAAVFLFACDSPAEPIDPESEYTVDEYDKKSYCQQIIKIGLIKRGREISGGIDVFDVEDGKFGDIRVEGNSIIGEVSLIHRTNNVKMTLKYLCRTNSTIKYKEKDFLSPTVAGYMLFKHNGELFYSYVYPESE